MSSLRLSIDIGGTHLRSRLSGLKNTIEKSQLTAQSNLIEFIKEYLVEYPSIEFIGISFAGQVTDGRILSSPNITVSHKNIKEYFQNKYPNLHLAIDNDLNCAILAESQYHKQPYIAALFIGTGLGAGVMDNRKLIRGYNNQSFELGHIPYQKAPFVCGCGKDNCIELYASGLGLEKWLTYSNSKYTTKDLKTLIEQKHPIAIQFQTALLHAIATLITLTNSKTIILGGGVISKNSYLLDYILENLPSQVMPSSLKGVNILLSSLENASLDGAGLLED